MKTRLYIFEKDELFFIFGAERDYKILKLTFS